VVEHRGHVDLVGAAEQHRADLLTQDSSGTASTAASATVGAASRAPSTSTLETFSPPG